MAALTITHTHAEGTLLEGSLKGDGVYEIVRRHGFAYFPSIKAIGIRQSRDQVSKRYQIERAAEALRAAGHDVDVQIDDQPRDREQVLADQADRLDDRREALTRKAGRIQGEANAAYSRADQISQRFEGGQPLIMGHHSTRRALRDREKMHDAMSRSVALQKEADTTAARADAVGNAAAHSERPSVTRRRIETTESELRVIARNLKGWTQRFLNNAGAVYAIDEHQPASGKYREQLLARQALLEERLRYDRAQLAKAEADGFVVWGPDNVHKGDLVKYWGGWKPVEKVNKVTVGCPSGYSWLDKVKFTDILAVKCTHREGAAVDLDAELVADALADHQPAQVTQADAEADGLAAARLEREARFAAIMAAPVVTAVAYFPTPKVVADRMAQMLPEGPLTVLEPSAGDGALVRAVLAARPQATITAIEPSYELGRLLGRLAAEAGPGYPSEEPRRVELHACLFEDFGKYRDEPPQFDAVVMNPPFSAPGHPVLWAEHVLLAYDRLVPGGRLVAVVPAGFAYRQDKTSARLRDLAAEVGGDWEDLPDGSFAAAGTQIRTMLICLNRPEPVAPIPDTSCGYQQDSLL